MNIEEPQRPARGFRALEVSSFQRWLRNYANKWRLALAIFIVFYATFLISSGFMAIQWDEISHLRGGQLLSQGRFTDYISSYGYYPPIYDLVTGVFFRVFGVSAEVGRFAAVTFAVLSIWLVFEFATRTYGPRVALASSVLLSVMPGFFWASKFALLETALVFFLSLTLFFFFSWFRVGKDRVLILSAVALGLGFLAKYQILVAGIIMIATILLLCRDRLQAKLSKFTALALIAVLIIVPWLLVVGFGKGNDLLYAITAGGEDRIEYSQRFFLPVFYLVEMTWPYDNTHPIFLPLFIAGLLGLGLWSFRRRTEDKFFLIWFTVVYVFFTLIPNKQWRYIVPLFPVLAISAASLLDFSGSKMQQAWKSIDTNVNRKRMAKVAVGALVLFTVIAVSYSIYDGYQWTARYQIHIPIKEATDFAAARLGQYESVAVLCASNSFNDDMVRFYFEANESKQNQVWQYPALAIDAFKPDFEVDSLVALCENRTAKYAFLYEYGAIFPYFNSTLTMHEVYSMLLESGRFTSVAQFGASPRTITIFEFT